MSTVTFGGRRLRLPGSIKRLLLTMLLLAAMHCGCAGAIAVQGGGTEGRRMLREVFSWVNRPSARTTLDDKKVEC
uniref:Uncharacterized protein n=1 Tax=Oryza sativa subsp. japonica TaxID=39947 RepID=Q53KR3_ORYSJ|nr:hypothetical protein LOC_Os11g13380 [Oryza sativa Japonica Group]